MSISVGHRSHFSSWFNHFVKNNNNNNNNHNNNNNNNNNSNEDNVCMTTQHR